jgi:hypothetical protein
MSRAHRRAAATGLAHPARGAQQARRIDIRHSLSIPRRVLRSTLPFGIIIIMYDR